jgi:membrane protein YqaA with SNARE-associated domain
MNLNFIPLQTIAFTMPEWFNQLGMIAIFLSSVIPFFPVPSEPIALGLLALDSSQGMILNIAIVIGIGAFISHIIVFVAGKHFHRVHKSIKKQRNLREEHIFHKYGIWLFLIVPSISIVIPPLPDALVGYLGHKRVNPMKLFTVIFVGEMIRIPLTYLTLTELLKLL